jgi:hypothetical protein
MRRIDEKVIDDMEDERIGFHITPSPFEIKTPSSSASLEGAYNKQIMCLS